MTARKTIALLTVNMDENFERIIAKHHIQNVSRMGWLPVPIYGEPGLDDPKEMLEIILINLYLRGGDLAFLSVSDN